MPVRACVRGWVGGEGAITRDLCHLAHAFWCASRQCVVSHLVVVVVVLIVLLVVVHRNTRLLIIISH